MVGNNDACHICTYSCVNRNVFFNSSLNISELHKNHMMKSPKVIYKIARCIFGGFEYNIWALKPKYNAQKKTHKKNNKENSVFHIHYLSRETSKISYIWGKSPCLWTRGDWYFLIILYSNNFLWLIDSEEHWECQKTWYDIFSITIHTIGKLRVYSKRCEQI